MVSAYRYSKQLGVVPGHVPFSDYVAHQLVDEAWRGNFGLVQGRYAMHLRPWMEAFDGDDLAIVEFEQLTRHPAAVATGMCRRVGVDPEHYDHYDFAVHNPARPLRSAYVHRLYTAVNQRLSHVWLADRPSLRAPLRRLRRVLEPVYLRLMAAPEEPVEMPESVWARLIAYYEDDVRELERLTGRAYGHWLGDPPGSAAC
jgi:hypothetical protein